MAERKNCKLLDLLKTMERSVKKFKIIYYLMMNWMITTRNDHNPIRDKAELLKSVGKRLQTRIAKSDPRDSGWQRDLTVSHYNIGNIKQAQS